MVQILFFGGGGEVSPVTQETQKKRGKMDYLQLFSLFEWVRAKSSKGSLKKGSGKKGEEKDNFPHVVRHPKFFFFFLSTGWIQSVQKQNFNN